MSIRLIALDIDGTLLDSRSQVPEVNRRAIAEAAAGGIEIALVTGRRYDFAMPIARQIPCPLTMIVNNGAVVKSWDGTTQMLRLLPVDVARRTLESTVPFRGLASVCFNRPRANQLIFESIDWNDPLRRHYFERNRDFIAEMSPLTDSLTEDPIQVMYTGRVSQAREVENHLTMLPFAAEFSVAVTLYDDKDFGLIDVISSGCSKGTTLAEWVRHRGLSREQVMAIGDNLNDREMLEYAGMPIVMGNAVPELRSFGWMETLSNDEGGVAAAIRSYVIDLQ
jgi:Cof subfamily protein (haloacid dehalogenase superfamily)